MSTPHHLLDHLPAALPEEFFDTLLEVDGFRVERIVSEGHASPPDFWYDQEQHEWVLLVEGAAGLEFQGNPEPVLLRPGSHVTIPAHTRHRVAWTAPDRKTVWLAIHYHT